MSSYLRRHARMALYISGNRYGAAHSLPGHHSGEQEYCAWYKMAQECLSCALLALLYCIMFPLCTAVVELYSSIYHMLVIYHMCIVTLCVSHQNSHGDAWCDNNYYVQDSTM